MIGIVKKIIRKSFFYNLLLRIKETVKIFLHDSQLFPIRYLRHYVRGKGFPPISRRPLPPIAHIETTSICNAACVMCPQSNMKRKLDYMGDSLYNKIIEQSKPLEALWIFMMGEPLMDEKLSQRIAYAKATDIKKVGIFTNGSLLNTDLAVKLLDSGIDHITISFDALSEKTFKDIRPGLNFQDVTMNIENLVRLRKKRKQKKPFIAIEFVKMERNASEAEPFRKKWERIVDAVYISGMVNWGGVNQTKPADWPSYKIRRPCYMLWRGVVIFIDGQVALCCYDYGGSVILGNANRQSLKEIWTGARLAEIRKMHLNGEFEKIPICANCNVWKMLSSPWW